MLPPSKWNLVFARLPVESIIHDHQQEYYGAINASNDKEESTIFIEFILCYQSITHGSDLHECQNERRKDGLGYPPLEQDSGVS